MTKRRLIKTDQTKVQQAREKDASVSVELYSPDPKKKSNVFLVCPPWTDEGPDAFVFFKKSRIHWRIPPSMDPSNQMISIRCSTDFGADHKCHSCNRVFKLRESSDPRDKEYAKEASAKTSYWMQGFDLEDLKDEDGKVKIKVWRAGYVAFNNLMAVFDTIGDFADLEKGRPLSIKVVQQAKRVDTFITPLDPMPVTKLGITVEEALEMMYDLSYLENLMGYMREMPWSEQQKVWELGKDWQAIEGGGKEAEKEDESEEEEAEEEEDFVEDDEESPFEEEEDEQPKKKKVDPKETLAAKLKNKARG